MRVRPRPSRSLTLWWAAVHALAATGVLASALPHPVAALVLAVLLGHSRWGRPRPAAPLDLFASGRWAVPGTSRTTLTLAEGTALGPFWIKLVLEGPAAVSGGTGRIAARGCPGMRVACLLLRDQLDPDTWRALQAELRRGARRDAH